MVHISQSFEPVQERALLVRKRADLLTSFLELNLLLLEPALHSAHLPNICRATLLALFSSLSFLAKLQQGGLQFVL